MEQALNILNRLRASLWLVPALLSAVAVVIAYVLLFSGLDYDGLNGNKYWWLFSGDAATARDLMSTLVSGMITMTSLVVSITMVVLSLAAGQLGPRLIQNFIADRQIQLVLGLFTSTIVYCLFVLRSISDLMGPGEVPHVAVTLGSFMAMLCLFALLFYIHKIARSIIADTVVAEVASELESAITDAATREKDTDSHDEQVPDAACHTPVSLHQSGYVQVIDYDALIRMATKADIVLHLKVRAGHFLLRGDPHLDILSDQPVPDGIETKIRRAFFIGHERTSTQDREYAVRQLVEIAVRALSPSINDTFTAIAVINRLAAAIEKAADRPRPPTRFFDDDGNLRVIAVEHSFAGLLDAAFNQIGQSAEGNPAVLIRMAHVYSQLSHILKDRRYRSALKVHTEKLIRGGERSIKDPVDLEDFLSVANPALERLL